MHSFFLSLAAVVLLISTAGAKDGKRDEKKVLIYAWADYVPDDVILDFERETGITVVYDAFDSNETLEARLVTGYSGYDVVFPSSSPHFPRALKLGAFQPLDYGKIPNAQGVHPRLLALLQSGDPGNRYGVPYVWGTSGFAYNVQKIRTLYPDAPVDSIAMIMDPMVVARFAPCGVSLLENGGDVFDALLLSLGQKPRIDSPKQLAFLFDKLLPLRPHIAKFSATQPRADLANGDLCLSQCWCQEAYLAQKTVREAGLPFDIAFVHPKEGVEIWCDMLAIPIHAPHPNNAHVFINFLLRPDIMARITNQIFTVNSVPASWDLLDPEIKNSPILMPDLDHLPHAYVQQALSPELDRQRTRLWIRFKTGK